MPKENDKTYEFNFPDFLGIPYLNTGPYNYYEANSSNLNKPYDQHWNDRNPTTGRVLKDRSHPTYWQFVEGENEVGSNLYIDPYGNEFTFIPNGSEEDKMPYMLEPFLRQIDFPEVKRPIAERKPQAKTTLDPITLTMMTLRDLELRQAYMESGYNPKAVSRAQAQGLFQIRPITYENYLKFNPGDEGDLFDPVYNKKVRDWTMQKLWNSDTVKKNNPPEEVRLAKMLAAYNWGATNLGKYLTRLKEAGKDIYSDNSWVEGLPKETREYVNYIMYHLPTRGKNDDEYNRKKHMYNTLF